MPYMQRITWSGIALHAVVVPGHPASHGCIRLKDDFAIRLWHLTKRGTRVIIAHDDVQPVEITNPHLFKPKVVSGLPEFQTATVAGKSISTAAATHGSLDDRFHEICGDAQGRLRRHRTLSSGGRDAVSHFTRVNPSALQSSLPTP